MYNADNEQGRKFESASESMFSSNPTERCLKNKHVDLVFLLISNTTDSGIFFYGRTQQVNCNPSGQAKKDKGYRDTHDNLLKH